MNLIVPGEPRFSDPRPAIFAGEVQGVSYRIFGTKFNGNISTDDQKVVINGKDVTQELIEKGSVDLDS